VFIVAVPVLIYSFVRADNALPTGQSILLVLVILLIAWFIFRSFKKQGRFYQWVARKFPKLIPYVDELFSANLSSKHFVFAIFCSLGVECCGIFHVFIASKALGLPVSLGASAVAYIVSVLLMVISPFLRGLGAVKWRVVITMMVI
jgi:phosphatidylglycerol lysyltransferase